MYKLYTPSIPFIIFDRRLLFLFLFFFFSSFTSFFFLKVKFPEEKKGLGVRNLFENCQEKLK